MRLLSPHRDDRPSMLFISPVLPARTGNGLAMRAAHNLLAFARRFRITLLVAPIHASPAGPVLAPDVADVCDAAVVLPAGTQPARPWRGALAGPFDVVHVFRLAAVPLAVPWLKRATTCRWLDLDDLESRVAKANADALMRAGSVRRSAQEAARAQTLLAAEQSAANTFDRLFVASEVDVPVAKNLGPARVSALPNIVELPEITPFAAEPPFRFLFVGTLGYEPNVEGLRWFVSEVWPEIRAHVGRETVLDVIGGGSHPGLRSIREVEGVLLHGHVPAVGPWYARSHVALVPILTGGGTRIKALEAFAHGRPVVGTAAGLAGIGVSDGVHALIAVEPVEFAAACIRLVEQPGLGRDLAERAREFVETEHASKALAAAVSELA